METHVANLHAAGIVHHDRSTGGVVPLLRNLASRPDAHPPPSLLASRLDKLEKYGDRLDKLEKTVSFHEEAILALEVTHTNVGFSPTCQ